MRESGLWGKRQTTTRIGETHQPDFVVCFVNGFDVDSEGMRE